MINQPTGICQQPPLGHLSVRILTKTLMDAWRENPETPQSADREACLDAFRSELQRRERLGVGVRL